jgi:hypothetical protein
MRDRITHELARLEHQQDALRHALEMIDQGESPEHVRSYLNDQATELLSSDGRRSSAERRAPRARREITPDQALSALSELNPGLHEHLVRLKEHDQHRYERELNRLRPRLESMALQKHAAPDQWEYRVNLFQAERRARRLAHRAVDATDEDERQASIDELTELVSHQFEHREQIHEMEIASAEQQAKTQRRRLEEARAKRKQLVQERVQHLLERAADSELQDDHPPRRQRR